MNKKRLDEIIEKINKHNILQSICGGMNSYDCAVSELIEYTLNLQQQLQQRDKVIKKAIKCIEDTMELSKECPSKLLKILNKYKGGKNE